MLKKILFRNKPINIIFVFFKQIFFKFNTAKKIATLKWQRDVARDQRDVARNQRDVYISQNMSKKISKQNEESKAWETQPRRHDRIALIIKKILLENNISEGKILEIGGRGNPYKDDIFSNYDYSAIDIEKTDDNVIVADITNCPELESEQYDFIFSIDVFEHINAPWLAANEITRLLKPNGVTYHSTLFSWRYHPCPEDYWRYTPLALSFIFSDLKKTIADFDDTERRRNIIGKGNNRLVEDSFGGWRENWRVHYAGIKK